MIVLDYPAILQAVNTAKWDGWSPYVGGSVWDNMISRQSYVDVKPKAAAAVTSEGASSATIWIAVAVVAVVAAGAGALIVRRRRGRALEE